MTEINKQLLVNYSAKQMYDLVNDIEKYPEFLQWCTSADIIEKSEQEITANLSLAYSGFSQSFTTKNTLVPNNKINLELVTGPFKSFNGEWSFTDINNQDINGCKIDLKIDFQFSNPILAMTVGKYFEGVASELVNNFYNRAKQIYGVS